MLPVIFILCVLQIFLPVCSLAAPSCFFTKKGSVYKDGNAIIGGFFPLYTFIMDSDINRPVDSVYTQFKFENYQYVLALVFAVEEINKNPHLLPNMSLGFDLYNVPYTEWKTLESSLTWLSGFNKYVPNYTCRRQRKSVAALTGTSWATCAQIGTLLELYKFPQLTFGPFDPILSDSTQFPSLYQMAPKDTSLALGMVSLLLHFRWTWVGVTISDDHKGIQFLSDITEAMERNKVCIAFVEVVPVTAVSYFTKAWSYHRQIRQSSANVVIIYGDADFLLGLTVSIDRDSIIWKVWITTSQWVINTDRNYFLLDAFHGTLIFSRHHEEISGFKNFIQTASPSKYPEDFYLTKLWYFAFNCSVSESDCKTLEDCPLNASLAWLPRNIMDMSMTDGSYNVYNAVYAVAQTLHEMMLQQVEMQPTWDEEGLAFIPWHLHPFLKNIQFKNPAGDQVHMDQKRKLDAKYDIFNFWNFPEGLGYKVKVGQFSPYIQDGQQLSLSEEMIEWSTGIKQIPHSVCSESCSPGFRKSPEEGKASCCFDCIPCPENEISNDTDMDQCMQCADHQYANVERNQCLQKAVTFLGYEDPLGKSLACTALGFSVLTVLALGIFVKHRDTAIVKANNRVLSYVLLISLTFCFLCSLLFIGRPNTATCILQQTTFGMVFTVAVSTVLAKTITVVLAFKITAPGRRIRHLLVSGAPNAVIPICSLIQLTLCGIWLGTSPPFIDTDVHAEYAHIIIVCNKGSATAFYCVLGYLGSLALGSFTVAFLARNLPDTFNEAKFLTFSMVVFCSVWVTFLPVYHSTKGKVMVAVEVFSILASSAGLLGCIFAPKCYVILLRPDRNSLHGFRDKVQPGSNKPS